MAAGSPFLPPQRGSTDLQSVMTSLQQMAQQINLLTAAFLALQNKMVGQ